MVEQEVAEAVAKGAQAIAVDAGSTDSGAAYLVTGVPKYNRGAIKRDLAIMMKAGMEAGIPVITGSAGHAGGDKNVDWLREVALEIAEELGIKPKIALLYCEQTKDQIKSFNAAGKVRPLAPMGPLEDSAVDSCDHIVAVLGAEPYMAALDAGADLIIGGRTTDTAVLACFALWKGAPWGPSWHAAKITECGTQCAVHRLRGSAVMVTIDASGFEVEPINLTNRCTPQSVSAHMLYENSNPFQLVEPGGVLDVTKAVYTAVNDRAVRVTGSTWEAQPYTVKLEGAGAGSYQTIMLIGIQDPAVLNRIDEFHDKMLASHYQRVRETIGEAAGDFHISLRMYGWNGVSGDRPPEGTPIPRELAVLFVATAATQQMAREIAKSCNPRFFHFPIIQDKELPSYGFPFSPAEVDRGPVYEFKLNHVIELDDPMSVVRTVWIDLSKQEAA